MNKPTVIEISSYLENVKNYDEFTAMGFADQFWHYYESVGWKVGSKAMKSWQAAIRTWEIKRKQNGYTRQTPSGNNRKPGTSEARIEALKNW